MRLPGTKLFTAWKVTTPELIENDVIVAMLLQLDPLQLPKGATMFVIRVSGVLLPEPTEMELVVVLTSAIDPASHMLTYTRLLSEEDVVNIRKRVLPGEYVAAGAQEGTGGTAYCVGEYCGAVSRESDGAGANSVELGVFGVMLSASNTVRMGTMQGDVVPTLGSEQFGSEE